MNPAPATLPPRAIRAILVDDEALLRQHLRERLERHPEIVIVGEAHNVQSAVELMAATRPGDVVLDPNPGDDGEDAFGPIAYLTDVRHEPTAVMEAHQRDVLSSDGLAMALDNLDARSRRIVEERWLKVNDDGSGGMTLHELAAEYGVSAERIRQIEVAAMKKMKATLAEFA